MKIATTSPRNQEVVFHRYMNEASDIPILTAIIKASEQSVMHREGDNSASIPLRWNSSTGKVTVPANGMDVDMLPGEYLVGFKSKKLEVTGARYFKANFKEQ